MNAQPVTQLKHHHEIVMARLVALEAHMAQMAAAIVDLHQLVSDTQAAAVNAEHAASQRQG